MAVSVGSTSYELKYGTSVGIKEDVVQKIHRLAISQRPFLARCGVEVAHSSWHEWMEDSIGIGTHIAKNEGAAFAGDTLVNPVRVGNSTQIIWKALSIPASAQAFNQHGYANQVAYQKERTMSDVLNALELSLVRGSTSTGATDAARKMIGLMNAITSYTSAFTSFALTETIFNDRCQVIYENADQGPTDVFVGAWLKRVISGFVANATRYVEADEKKQVQVVDTYHGDFGSQRIHLSQYVLSGANACAAIWIRDVSQLKIAYAPGRAPHFEKFAKTADTGEEGNYVALLEGTLNFGAQGNMTMGTGFRNAA